MPTNEHSPTRALTLETVVATWWKVSKYDNKLTKVEVYKETPEYIYTKRWSGQKAPERVSKADHYPTWSEARAAKIAALTSAIDWKKQELHRLRSDLGQVESLQEPK